MMQEPSLFLSNSDIMKTARTRLNGNWKIAAAVFIVYIILLSVTQAFAFIGFLIDPLLGFGMAVFFLSLVRQKPLKIELLWNQITGFERAWRIALNGVLVMVFVLLWSLLLIVPGIMAYLSYFMSPYLLADNDQLTPLAAIRESKAMMMGHRWQFACLNFRFVGWILISLLTCGVGFIWVVPYMNTAYAVFYEELKKIRSL